MTNTTHHTNKFEPLHSGHAIEQVAFSLKLATELTDTQLTAAGDAAKSMAGQDLPKVEELRGVKFEFGINLPIPTPPSQLQLAGYQLQKFQPNGSVESELRVERSLLSYRTHQYSRWAALWKQARTYIEPIIANYSGLPIVGISLEYVDKFVWNGAIEECRTASLLNNASPYLCPYIYKTQDLWHSHTGAFLRKDAQTKRLLNVNVDYLDEQPTNGPRRIVVIRTVMSDLLNQPGYERLDADSLPMINIFEAHMQSLHSFNKEVLLQIISPDMSRRIGLES